MKNVAVVILNYNGKKFLELFLPSLCAHSEDAQLVVIDNASQDDSVSFLKANYPSIQLIQNPDNQGFAKGYNTGLAQVKADYFVLLNSDVKVTPNWLKPLFQLMEREASIAACQPKIKNYNKPSYFEYAGAAGGYIDRFGYPFCRGRVFETLEKDEQQYEENQAIFWASGACLMVRAALYKKLGGLDADFFAHMEEIDFCWRLQQAGYNIFYCAESEVLHVGGGTLQMGSPFKTYLNFRNNLVMLIKNLPSQQLFFIVFFRMVLDGIAGIKFLSEGRVKHFWAMVRAHLYLYRNFLTLIKKRKATQKLATHSSQAKRFPSSIVWQYFIRRKQTFGRLRN